MAKPRSPLHPQLYALTCCALITLAACTSSATRKSHQAGASEGTRATLAILESTDIHTNVLSYDYYKLTEEKSLGFERLAALVREARKEYENTLLFDAGDTIQGTALADWQARSEPLACDQKLAMYKAMDELGFDGGTIGNHEFNYGLPFLAQVTNAPLNVDGVEARPCRGPDFPLVLANVFSAKDGKPLFPPTALLERKIRATDAKGRAVEAPIRVGIIGFAPPPILQWDKSHLQGRVTTKGIVEAAREFAPTLRAQGADIVIAISHGGVNTAPYSSQMENANWYLAQEPEIDVLLLGHSHQAFPDPGNEKSRFANMPGVDNNRGFIHGKPAVMGSFWGKALGVIELALVHKAGKWVIDPSSTHSEVRSIRNSDGSFVEPDPSIRAAIEAEHEATLRYVSTPIGDSDFAMTSYFAAVGDVSSMQPVNTAQREFVKKYIASNLPQLAGIPVISSIAPFKSGFGGASDYTDIAAGPLAIRNAADLYLFPNTVSALRINGAMVKAWLEKSANYFNQIDPANPAPQELINRKYPSYNFDVIQGQIAYAIDVSKPVGERIVELTFQGKPIDPAQPFIMVTNNYRANGKDFPGAGADNLVLELQESNRDVLIDWVRQRKHLTREQDGSDRAWRFARAQTAGPVVFQSASGKIDIARAAGLLSIQQISDHGNGMATYSIDLSQ